MSTTDDELNKRRSEGLKAWHRNMTPEERAAQTRKQRAGLARYFEGKARLAAEKAARSQKDK